jgi:nicotinate-nucleotide adenylyltransferase
MRVGLLGGSFNPAHEGHAHVAETALTRLGLDRVIWMVSPQNPLKDARESAPLSARLDSARAKAKGSRMAVTDLETRIGSRYTIDTLRALKARWPGVKFVWVMGADNLADIGRWRGWREIFRLVPVAVVSRPGAVLKGRASLAARRFAAAELPAERSKGLADAAAPAWTLLRAPLNPASSTAIRAAGPRRSRDDGTAPTW